MGMTRPPLLAALLALCIVLTAPPALAQTTRAAEPTPPAGPLGLMPGRPMAPAISAEMKEARDFALREKWQEASEIIDKALSSKPRDPQWRFLQGVVLAGTGKSAEAIRTFEALTEDFPELSEPYNNLAALYVDQNELHKARLLLERAVQNRPDYALAHENLGDIYTRLAAQSYRQALASRQPAPSVKLKLDYLNATPAIRPARIMTNR
jgi:tetratricopeptide (TPR) repeat protein